MKRTTKFALIAASALTIALTGAAVNAHPEGGWGNDSGYGMGYGGHMGYGMGPGHGMGYGMGPGGHMGYGFGGHMGYGPGGGHMGYGMGYGYGMGSNGVLQGFPDDVAERLDALKSTLAITDSQQGAWQTFAGVVKKQSQNRLAWFEKMHKSEAPRTTPEWLAQRNEAMKQLQTDNETVTTALSKLYQVLTPEQRTLLDRGPVATGPRDGWRGR